MFGQTYGVCYNRPVTVERERGVVCVCVRAHARVCLYMQAYYVRMLRVVCAHMHAFYARVSHVCVRVLVYVCGCLCVCVRARVVY